MKVLSLLITFGLLVQVLGRNYGSLEELKEMKRFQIGGKKIAAKKMEYLEAAAPEQPW